MFVCLSVLFVIFLIFFFFFDESSLSMSVT